MLEIAQHPTVPATPAQMPLFFYDLTDPWCYLAAEQIMGTLPVVPEWEPVLGAALGPVADEQLDPDRIARRAAELGLQPLRWPAGWPPEGRSAALAATYAKRGGRTVAFSLAAFRQAFAGGRDLAEEATLMLAGAACEVHPRALLKGMGLRSTTEALDMAGDRARALGVRRLPAVVVDEGVYSGERCVEEAAAALSAPHPR